MTKEVIIPEGFSDITVEQLASIRALKGSDEFIGVKTLEILTGITGDEALRMKISDRNEILTTITEALTDSRMPLVQTFMFDGVEYGFIPNLDDMTYGEFVDLELYQNNPKNTHKMLAVFYRPIVNKNKKLYTIEPYGGSAKYMNVMKNISSHILVGVEVFFYNIVKELQISSLSYLREEVQTKKIEHLQKNGGGTVRQVASLITTLQDSIPSQVIIINNALPNLRIYQT